MKRKCHLSGGIAQAGRAEEIFEAQQIIPFFAIIY